MEMLVWTDYCASFFFPSQASHAQVNLYEKEFYVLVRSYSHWRLSVVLHQTMHLPKAHW